MLEGSWNNTAILQPVDIPTIFSSFKSKSLILSEVADEYLTLKDIDHWSSHTALEAFLHLAGDRDVSQYTREDAKLFVRHLEMKGNNTATVRRRINSLSAILNYAYAELDLDNRNPFSRLLLKGEGEDS